MRKTIQITPADVSAACGYLAADPAHYLRSVRPLPTTPGRRRAAILAAGRDALAAALIVRFSLPNIGALTKAIRAGHAGADTDFDAINQAGAVALGIWEN